MHNLTFSFVMQRYKASSQENVSLPILRLSPVTLRLQQPPTEVRTIRITRYKRIIFFTVQVFAPLDCDDFLCSMYSFLPSLLLVGCPMSAVMSPVQACTSSSVLKASPVVLSTDCTFHRVRLSLLDVCSIPASLLL